MAITYTPLGTLSSTGSTATFSFTSIPGTYTDLVLVCSLRSSYSISTHDTLIRVNGSTSTLYSRTKMEGDGSSGGGSQNVTQTGFYSGQVQGASSTAGYFSTQVINLMDYSSSANYKTFLSRNNTSTNWVSSIVGLWRSTSAITQIDILNADGANWVSGSTATLYGIKAA